MYNEEKDYFGEEDLGRHMHKFKHFINLFSNIINSVPGKDDTNLQKVVKSVNLGLNVMQTFNEIKFSNALEGFVVYGVYYNHFLKSLIFDGMLPIKLKQEHRFTQDRTDLIICNINKIGKVAYYAKPGSMDYESGYNFYLSKDFKFEELNKMIYHKYGDRIFIQSNSLFSEFNSGDIGKKYSIEKIVTDDKILNNKTIERADKLLQEPGTYLFYGEPGTGKSSFVFSEVFKDKKCIKIGAEHFLNTNIESLNRIFKILQPDMLVVEEIDKFKTNLAGMLVFLERIRKEKYKIVFTANSIDGFHEAVTRPQRIDYILKFELPNEEEIKTLVDFYCNSKNKDEFFEFIKDKEFSHAYIVDLSKKLKDHNFDDVKNYIEFLISIRK